MTVTRLVFQRIGSDVDDVVACLSLNRPDVANAFNSEVMQGLQEGLSEAANNPKCRALVLTGEGKHFSAGADLGGMQDAAKLSFAGNTEEAHRLTQFFESLANLPMPTIAAVRGAAYGGAVGLTACCDIAIAADNARFCLSEVKLGLLPAVILPYLGRKIVPGQLRRLMLTGRIFLAEEAVGIGLVQRVCPKEELADVVREELSSLLEGAPSAQTAIKELHCRVARESFAQGPHTAENIARARVGPEGQAGLQAFFDKKPAPWARSLAPDWSPFGD